MQFDDGSGETSTGPEISVPEDGQNVDLGLATLDTNHDGVADSVVVGNGSETDVFTDTNHDGVADTETVYDSGGHEVDPQTGAQISPGSTSDDSAGDNSTAAGTSPGEDPTGSDSSSGHEITVTGEGDEPVEVGLATVDLNQDGTPDTAVVHNEDGTTTAYTDTNGDGTADQITQIGTDGKVVIASMQTDGSWEVVATGHLDSTGALVEDSTPQTSTLTPEPAGQHSYQSGVVLPMTGAGSASGPTSDLDRPAGDPVARTGESAGDITLTADGKSYDLGAPTADMNGDGTADTVVTHESDGTVVAYTDTEGTGTADQITTVHPDGTVVIGVSDGHGGWEEAAKGHLDADGNFVAEPVSTGRAASQVDARTSGQLTGVPAAVAG